MHLQSHIPSISLQPRVMFSQLLSHSRLWTVPIGSDFFTFKPTNSAPFPTGPTGRSLWSKWPPVTTASSIFEGTTTTSQFRLLESKSHYLFKCPLPPRKQILITLKVFVSERSEFYWSIHLTPVILLVTPLSLLGHEMFSIIYLCNSV